MIIEIVLGILVLTEAYIIWNLNNKTETLETWMESFSNSVYQIQSDLKDIDSRGHFEAVDEVGSIFSQIKDTVETLNQYIEEPK